VLFEKNKYKKLVVLLLLGINLIFPEHVFSEEIPEIQDSQVKCSAIEGEIVCVDKEVETKLKAKCRVEKGRIICEPEKEPAIEAYQENKIFSLDKTYTDIKTSTASVDVITSDQMRIMHNPDLSTVLNLLSGVTVQNKGSAGNAQMFRIRGWDKVGITLDGVKIDNYGMRSDDPGFSKPYLSYFLTEGLDRVEVIRGPQGTMHGNMAQGGLISMFTKKGQGTPSVEMNTGLGSFGTIRENIAFEGGDDSADYYLGVTMLSTQGGMKTTPEKESKRDDYDNITISSNLGKRFLNGKAEIRNTLRYTKDKKEIGVQSYGYPHFDPNDESKHSNILESLTLTHAPTNWYDYNVKVGLYESSYKNTAPADSFDIWDPVYDKVQNTRLMVLTQHNIKYKDLNTLSLGYNAEYNHFKSIYQDSFANDFNAKDLATNDIYMQDTLNFKDTLIVKGGIRISDSSKWGTYGIPNVSGALVLPTFNVPDSYTKIRSSYGMGVNYPNPYQLFGKVNGVEVGNSALNPEKVESWDIGMVQSFYKDKVNLELGYYISDYKDLIGYTTGYENIDKAKISGIESSLKINPMPGLKGLVNYTYTHGEDNRDRDLPGVPKSRLNFLPAMNQQRSTVYIIELLFQQKENMPSVVDI